MTTLPHPDSQSQATVLKHVPWFRTRALNGYDAICDLAIYRTPEGKIAVVASEIITAKGEYLEEGVSVTNACEELATAVRNELGIDFDYWIEHYPERGSKSLLGDESWDFVRFIYNPGQTFGMHHIRLDYREPEWQHTTREAVMALLGQPVLAPQAPTSRKVPKPGETETAFKQRIGSCTRCGRALSDPKSMERGMGPICARKVALEAARRAEDAEAQNNPYINVSLDQGIVLQRTPDGQAATNVPWAVKHHSPTGFEWGYLGSGCADLALNILEIVLRRLKYEGERVDCYNGKCFKLAYTLHQDFKEEFIAGIDREGGTIPIERVETWVNTRIVMDDVGEDED